MDTELLLAHALGLERLQLYLQFERPLNAEEIDAVRALVRRRGEGEPVAYLVGARGFRDLDFRVDARVLVPRPETELLVEIALDAIRDVTQPWIADVGTGSGCVAISVLHENPAARAVGTDVSGDALVVASENAKAAAVSDRLQLVAGDLLRPLTGHEAWAHFDAVVSNPPYIVRGDPDLAADVAQHEPASALFVPGDDPLEVARGVAEQAREALRAGGTLAIEIGHRSGASAVDMLETLGYAAVRLVKDLGGIDRVVVGENP